MRIGFGSRKQVGGSTEMALGLGRGSVAGSVLGCGLFGNVLNREENSQC